MDRESERDTLMGPEHEVMMTQSQLLSNTTCAIKSQRPVAFIKLAAL